MLHILGLVESPADYLCIRIQKEKKRKKERKRHEVRKSGKKTTMKELENIIRGFRSVYFASSLRGIHCSFKEL